MSFGDYYIGAYGESKENKINVSYSLRFILENRDRFGWCEPCGAIIDRTAMTTCHKREVITIPPQLLDIKHYNKSISSLTEHTEDTWTLNVKSISRTINEAETLKVPANQEKLMSAFSWIGL